MYTIKENVSLEGYTTFHVPAIARYFVEVNDESQVGDFLNTYQREKNSLFVLGGGSNVLFTRNFKGTIVKPQINGIQRIKEKGPNVFIRSGAGENWDDLVQYCVDQNLGGVENLSWIPGTVGAGPVQNIGAYGVEIKDVVEKVEGYFIDSGKKFNLTAADCLFGYRNSVFKNKYKGNTIITHVTFRLTREHLFHTSYPDLQKEMDEFSDTTIRNIRQAIIKIRKFKLPDPAENGNAGSFFKNPLISPEKAAELRQHFPDIPLYAVNDGTSKVSAAWLIEQAGWKGKNYGKAGTYKRQPLIIINLGGATGEEIMNLAMKIRNTVMNKFGIKLEMEVNII